jgi:hypothetical protein
VGCKLCRILHHDRLFHFSCVHCVWRLAGCVIHTLGRTAAMKTVMDCPTDSHTHSGSRSPLQVV